MLALHFQQGTAQKKYQKSWLNEKMSSLPRLSFLSLVCQNVSRIQGGNFVGFTGNVHLQCDKSSAATSFPQLQRRTSDRDSVFSLRYFQVHHLQFSLPREAGKQRSVTGTASFQFLPPSSPQEERRIVCTKTSKPAPPLPGRSEVRQRGWKEELEGRGTREEAGKGERTSCAVTLWSASSENCRTHLRVNTGSRCWKWAPALRRSWTCWATGGRRRTAGGWAPSCWTSPTLSYVPSARPRCSFCHRKNTSDYSQVRHAAQASQQQRGPGFFPVDSQLKIK